MKVLGVDTSTDRLAVSIINGDRVLAVSRSRARLRHSALLMPVIKKLLDKNRLKPEDIGLFGVGIGPGSFTGLRIGVTAVRGLAFALEKPIVGVPSMDAIAYNVQIWGQTLATSSRASKGLTPNTQTLATSSRASKGLTPNTLTPNTLICPLLDAKQGKVYACFYKIKDGRPVRRSGYILEDIGKLCSRIRSPTIFLGDGVKLYKGYIGLHTGARVRFYESENWYPKGEVIARLALERFRDGQRDSVYDLVPMYMYSKECHILNKRH